LSCGCSWPCFVRAQWHLASSNPALTCVSHTFLVKCRKGTSSCWF
jgi:hypothetical protein